MSVKVELPAKQCSAADAQQKLRGTAMSSLRVWCCHKDSLLCAFRKRAKLGSQSQLTCCTVGARLRVGQETEVRVRVCPGAGLAKGAYKAIDGGVAPLGCGGCAAGQQ